MLGTHVRQLVRPNCHVTIKASSVDQLATVPPQAYSCQGVQLAQIEHPHRSGLTVFDYS